jgi:predicted CXXCH cytochrome family protein
MKRQTIAPLLVLLGLGLPAAAAAQGKSCLDCHVQLEDELKAPATAFSQDVHGQFGLGCQDCHGGNPASDDVEKAKDKTFKGVPKRDRIPEFCGGCHADAAKMRGFNPSLRIDQLDQYWTSRHGQRLKAGDTKVAVCTDCHGVHGIQTAKFPKSMTFPWNIPQTCGRCHADQTLMASYNLPAGQLEDYKASVHARALVEKKDLSAPTCNDCHGNHGAFPPEAGSVGGVCRQCHPSAGELFAKSPHKKAFVEIEAGECEACHGNHKIDRPTNALLGSAEGSACVQCHEPGSKGLAAAAELRTLLDAFESGTAAAENLLNLADRKGVEVSEVRFKLQDVHTTLVSAKNLTHGLDVGELRKTIGDGEKALAEVDLAGQSALAEARSRLRGLIIATFCLVLVAIALGFKVRRLKTAKNGPQR